MKTLCFACGLIVGLAVAGLIGYGEVRRAWDAEEQVHREYDEARARADNNFRMLEAQLFAARVQIMAERPAGVQQIGCGEAALERVAQAAALGNSAERLRALQEIVVPCVSQQLNVQNEK